MAYAQSFEFEDSYDEEEALKLALSISMNTDDDQDFTEDYQAFAGPSYNSSNDITEEEMLEIALAFSKEDQKEQEFFSTLNFQKKIETKENSFHALSKEATAEYDYGSSSTNDVVYENEASIPLGLEDMEKPHPFIITRSNGSLGINAEVLEYFNSITLPLVIISVAGIYRTGKSYLLNRLLGKQIGFPLGSTVQSETKGIWIWISPHPQDSGKMMVLLDTEGLADPEKGDATHDAKIFCLALLLSSTFVYNSKGTIDNNSLQDLQMTTELSSHIRLKARDSQEDEEDLEAIFPKFVWAVRDFFLKCEVDGEAVSPNEYLEWSLQLKKGHGQKASQANSVRKSIKESFKERHCFLFPFPTTQEKLQQLEQLKFEELDEKFVNTSQEFTETVFDISTQKTVLGKDVTGRMFLNLAKCYVEAINKGGVPVIENAVVYITKVENEKAKEKALTIFKSRIGAVQLPVTLDELTRRISENQKETIKMFASLCIFDDQQVYSAELAQELNKCAIEILDENLRRSKAICENLIDEHFKDVSRKIQDGTYLHSRGYEQYQEDYFEALELYEVCSVGQQAKQSVLLEYRRKSENERMQILNADNKLHEEEKKIMMLEMQKQEEEARKEQALRDMEELQQRSIEAEQNYKDGLELYKREMTQRANVEKEQLKKRMEQALKENERLLRQGFADEAKKGKSKLMQLENQLKQKDSESGQRYRQLEQRLDREMKNRNEAHQRDMNRLAAIANKPPVVVDKRGVCVIS
eukprot:GFUD01011847.1.p1 GENE.GFUD01011847.1~~GFUD01011847.1.p1  ORF type:complete len:754 (-),score=206.68 GFUD01011847.1:94-2355(-)